jgi:hypothetical protein
MKPSPSKSRVALGGGVGGDAGATDGGGVIQPTSSSDARSGRTIGGDLITDPGR